MDLLAQQPSQRFAGAGQHALNAAIRIAAVLPLSWHILSLSRHAREMARGRSRSGPAPPPASPPVRDKYLARLAVLREGSEVVLFSGCASAKGTGPGPRWPVASPAWPEARRRPGRLPGSPRIPTAKLFTVTNALVALLAAGMAGQAAVFLPRPTGFQAAANSCRTHRVCSRTPAPVGRALHGAWPRRETQAWPVAGARSAPVLCGRVSARRPRMRFTRSGRRYRSVMSLGEL